MGSYSGLMGGNGGVTGSLNDSGSIGTTSLPKGQTKMNPKIQTALDPAGIFSDDRLGLPGAAPGLATLQQGTDAGDVMRAQKQSDSAIKSQQALLNALQKQGGIANQTDVYNQEQGLATGLAGNNGAANLGNVYDQSQGLQSQLAGANAVGNQSQALAQQQNLAQQQQGVAQQYQNIANGQGPNPAQMALNNATGQNVANQSALMASQRGAGANSGLIARQAAQQGAATQQQAAGQSAEMQAQQQLGALSGLSGQQQAIGGTNQSVAAIAGQQLAAQQSQQQALAAQAAQQVGLQQQQQNMMSGVAGQQVSQEMGQNTATAQAALAREQQRQAAVGAQNTAAVQNQGNLNTGNVALATTNAQGKQGMLGGLLGGAGAAIGAGSKAYGGEITRMAEGGDPMEASSPAVESPAMPSPQISSAPSFAPPPPPPPAVAQPSAQAAPIGPTSSYGKFISGWDNGAGKNPIGGGAPSGDNQSAPAPAKKNGLADAIPAIVSLIAMAKGGDLAQSGGHVAAKAPGQKAVKKGNSYDNDKIPAMLSEGEIVIPRDVLQGKDPARGAADFVAKVLAKRRTS